MSEGDSKRRFLEIEYKANILTLVTFAMSLVALSWQIANYLKGPDIKLFKPDQIIIGSSEVVGFPNRDGGPYMHILGRMSYVNEGAQNYNAVMRREIAEISIPGQPTFVQRWYKFVTANATGTDGAQLQVDTVADASPFPLLAGSSETHLTFFQPWPAICPDGNPSCNQRENYVTWDEFLERTKDKPEFEVQFIGESYDGSGPVLAACKVKLNTNSYNGLKLRRWASPICR